MGFRIIPRIMPESYLKLPNSEPWYICKIRTCVLWALFFATIRHGLHYASCCFWAKSDNSTLQRHPAMAPTCQLQSAHTTLTAAPCSGTTSQLQSGHATLTAAPCSVQQHPSLAPLQHELGTVRTLLAAPWSITPCSSTSRLARQHPQAAPSTRIRSPACPLQSMASSTHQSDSSTEHHPQAAPAAAPWHHQHRSKLYTPVWQQAAPCTSTLQRHPNGTTMPAPKHTHHSDSSTHSVNSMPAPKRSTYGIITNSWNIFGVSVGKQPYAEDAGKH